MVTTLICMSLRKVWHFLLNFFMCLHFVLEHVLCRPHVLFAAPLVDSVELSGTVRRFLSRYHGYHIFVKFSFTDCRTAVVLFRESFTSVETPRVSCSLIKLSLPAFQKLCLFGRRNDKGGNCSNPYYCKKKRTSAHNLLSSELNPGRAEPLSKVISER